MREWKAWTRRRMNDEGDGRKNERKRKTTEDWPEEDGKHFEGDIVLTGEQADQILNTISERAKREEEANEKKERRRVKRKFIGSRVRLERREILREIEVTSFRFVAGMRKSRSSTALMDPIVSQLKMTRVKSPFKNLGF